MNKIMSHILRNGFRPERERNLEEPGSGGLGQGTQMTSVFTAIETPAVGDVFRVEKKSRHRLHQDKKKISASCASYGIVSPRQSSILQYVLSYRSR